MPRVARCTVDANAAEDYIYKFMKIKFGEQVVRERLDIGDIKFELPGGDDQEPRVHLIERKSLNDWAASIKDGRYKEQKQRFLCAIEDDNTSLSFLIEGKPLNCSGFHSGMACKALKGAMILTQHRDKMPVDQSTDKQDTCEMVAYMFQKFVEGAFTCHTRGGRKVAVGDKTGSKRKRDNNKEEAAIRKNVLLAVDGMSAERADAIIQEFPTLTDICHAGVDAVGNIRVAVNGGKPRKIGPAVAQRILETIKVVQS